MACSHEPTGALAARLSPENEFRLANAKHIAIAVPDQTRPTDTVAALNALRARLPQTAKITVVVGLGMHRPLSEREIKPLRNAVDRWELLQHDPTDVLQRGHANNVPCTVFRPIADADCVVAVGTIALHQYAGFSGGHKAVAIGCGGTETLDTLHSRDWVCDPSVQVGRLNNNIFREAVDALGRKIGCIASLMQLSDGRWIWSDSDTVVPKAAAALTPWLPVPLQFDRAVILVDETHASNFYQASRAATYLALSPKPPLKPGAEIQLVAKCPEGIGSGQGEQAFKDVWERWAPSWSELLTTKNPPIGAGCQRAFMLARAMNTYRISVWQTQHPKVLRDFGIEAHREPPPNPNETLVIDAPFDQLPQWMHTSPLSSS